MARSSIGPASVTSSNNQRGANTPSLQPIRGKTMTIHKFYQYYTVRWTRVSTFGSQQGVADFRSFDDASALAHSMRKLGYVVAIEGWR